ncbi:P-type conjugative transfer protein TrbG [Sphingomonas sp. CBMAI 2297]|uniref:P-type conjugative transfer protein TrbG n=1 Tax=Sphingomonas sp. CBMAI 2297 TaxID=2991720 RepID=UPI00245681FD|nr:P-type conjugative transfer protein TrbG [Sphingomonas sp. CBMAI 2297]MDH4744245.1 P-type conjugative transfer protein TrbG [Sphingomonas sp. CBMAI 2297]
MNRTLLAASALVAVPAFAQTSPPQPPQAVAASPSPPSVATAIAPSPSVARPVAPQRHKPSPAELRVRTANAKATQEPAAPAFVNAVQVYPYGEGVLYRLFAAPERVSDIALQPGEAIVSVAAGDTARWTVGDTTSGAGESRRVHILVKPFAAGLSTNLVITTDRRAYHLQLDSTPATAMAALSWTYPQDEMIAIRRQQTSAEAARPVASGLAVERLDFGYVLTGDKPAWRPLRAFDDGRQTFVEFPASVGVGEAPPLFVIGDRGDAQLVNYRMTGRFYVVDRLFDAAELRLGTKKQAVVRIVRVGADRSRRQRRAS